MSLYKIPAKPSAGFLFKSAGIGVCIFWLVGIWFLPEKVVILKYFRGYIAVGFWITLLGFFVYEKGGFFVKKLGVLILGLGFGCIGAFFAMCFYLFAISMFK